MLSAITIPLLNKLFQSNLYFVSGRNPATDSLNLESVGVKTDEKSKKIIGNHDHDQERSSVPNIYAIGDVLHVSWFLFHQISSAWNERWKYIFSLPGKS